MKRTKIIATLGPASQSEIVLRKMVFSGMDIARLNFSHGSYKSHAELIKRIRKIAPNVAIMQDLQGPRFRVGKLPESGLEVHSGSEITLGKKGQIPLEINIAPFFKKDSHILIHDGLVEIRVLKIKNNLIYGRVLRGNIIFTGKGVNIPGAKIKGSVITKKDKKDLKFGLRQGVDFVALSFVKEAKNIKDLRRLIGRSRNSGTKIIAKIERHEALTNFSEILDSADGIMIARGDLGIELSPEKVPLWQKSMIEKCLKAAKPVIVATQMLDSMIRNPRPTRAEVSDVANAVIDHADSLMLSGETAFGKYPVESLKIMTKIIQATEKSHFDDMPANYFIFKNYSVRDSLAQNVFELVQENKAKAVIINSLSGDTVRLICRHRPETKIIALTNNKEIIRQLNLSWGVIPLYLKFYENLDNLIKNSIKEVLKHKLVKKGDRVILVSGQPTGRQSRMNLIKVQVVG